MCVRVCVCMRVRVCARACVRVYVSCHLRSARRTSRRSPDRSNGRARSCAASNGRCCASSRTPLSASHTAQEATHRGTLLRGCWRTQVRGHDELGRGPECDKSLHQRRQGDARVWEQSLLMLCFRCVLHACDVLSPVIKVSSSLLSYSHIGMRNAMQVREQAREGIPRLGGAACDGQPQGECPFNHRRPDCC